MTGLAGEKIVVVTFDAILAGAGTIIICRNKAEKLAANPLLRIPTGESFTDSDAAQGAITNSLNGIIGNIFGQQSIATAGIADFLQNVVIRQAEQTRELLGSRTGVFDFARNGID